MFFYQMSLPIPASSQNSTKIKNHSSLVCIIYDAHNGAHFIEINVKIHSKPRPSKCAAFYGAQHIISPAQLFQNMISKSVHHFATTAGLIR